MRIWDIDAARLCDQHLLGEHRELHAIWSILTTGKRGYTRHPETLRWRGRLAALYRRHDEQGPDASSPARKRLVGREDRLPPAWGLPKLTQSPRKIRENTRFARTDHAGLRVPASARLVVDESGICLLTERSTT